LPTINIIKSNYVVYHGYDELFKWQTKQDSSYVYCDPHVGFEGNNNRITIDLPLAVWRRTQIGWNFVTF